MPVFKKILISFYKAGEKAESIAEQPKKTPTPTERALERNFFAVVGFLNGLLLSSHESSVSLQEAQTKAPCSQLGT